MEIYRLLIHRGRKRSKKDKDRKWKEGLQNKTGSDLSKTKTKWENKCNMQSDAQNKH